MRPNITIKDIAQKLNVSVSTVSRALRDTSDINAETKQKVLDLAKSLDYQPNQVALSLVKSSTKTLGVVVPNIGYSFFASVLQGIDKEASKEGYSLLLCQSNEQLEKEKSNIQNLLRSQVEGFIISLTDNRVEEEHIQKLVKKRIPLVVFDRYSNLVDCSKVIIDNKEASKTAVMHLIQQGSKRVAMLAGPAHLHISHRRIEGYKEALRDAKLPFDPSLILHCDFSLQNVSENIQAFWTNQAIKPDGIFASSDRIAISAIHTLKKLQVKVPEEVSVIGFNDDPMGAMFTPSLSTVAQPSFEIGQEVVKLLLEQIRQPDYQASEHKTIVLPTKLNIRESSVKK